MIYKLRIKGIDYYGHEFSDVVEVGPAPDLATAIMWECQDLSDCTYVLVVPAELPS